MLYRFLSLWAFCVFVFMGQLPFNTAYSKGNNDAQVMEFKAATFAQWAHDNSNQIAKLNEQLKTNELLRSDMVMSHKQSWERVSKLNSDSIKILTASHALADEMEKGSAYLVSKSRSKVIESCLKDSKCMLQEKLRSFDEVASMRSERAIHQARMVKQSLKQQIHELSQLSFEGRDATSRSDALDTMAKINAQAGSSLIALNDQFASVVEFLSLDTATRVQDKNIKKAMSSRLYTRLSGLEPDFDLSLKSRMGR